MKKLLLAFLLLSMASASLFSEELNGDQLTIKLITLGPGKELYLWWGHTSLTVENNITGESINYNFGNFSFHQDHFYVNFVKGILLYFISARDTNRVLAFEAAHDRDIYIQTLDLPPEKKLILAKQLEDSIKPENRYYLYHHYLDNCSTRLRDLLDQAVDGALYEKSNVDSGTNFRGMTRQYSYRNFFIDWMLMFPMGDILDKPRTDWDAMFLPIELMHQVADLEYIDSQGNIRQFEQSFEYYHQSHSTSVILEESRIHWPYSLLLGIGFGSFLLFLRMKMLKGKLLYTGSIVIGIFDLFLGLAGVLLTFVCFFTDHTVTYNNENLFVVNPVFLIAFIFIISLLGTKSSSRVEGIKKRIRFHTFAWDLIAVSALISLLLKLLFPRRFDHYNWLTLCFMLPNIVALSHLGSIGINFIKKWSLKGEKTGKVYE